MKPWLALAVLATFASISRAEEPPVSSTVPIGSSFYRHLAFDLDTDLHELVKFERRGFGRSEIVMITLLAKISSAPIKDYGRRRVQEMVPLRDLAGEAGLDYDTLRKIATVVKLAIEAKGDRNLPPPQYDTAPSESNREGKDRKQKRDSDVDLDAESKPKPPAASPVGPPTGKP